MTDGPPPFDVLHAALENRVFPGCELTIEHYESALSDYALLAPAPETPDIAHPIWLVIVALRGLGIEVQGLCHLAGMRPNDSLLYGNCGFEMHRTLRIGDPLRVQGAVTSVARKESHDGSQLDFITVRCEVHENLDGSSTQPAGTVSHTFIIKRAA